MDVIHWIFPKRSRIVDFESISMLAKKDIL